MELRNEIIKEIKEHYLFDETIKEINGGAIYRDENSSYPINEELMQDESFCKKVLKDLKGGYVYVPF